MRAVEIKACVFVQTASNKVFVFDGYGNPTDINVEALSSREASAFMAMQDAFNFAVSKNGQFAYQNHICPWDYSNNNATMAQHGLFTFPSAIITATYPDGSGKMYVLGKEFIDKITGGIWTKDKIYPYIRVLLLGVTPQENDTTFLCKLLPPLCTVGSWVWFGLALGATLKANNSKSIGKGLWGTGAAFLWYEWYQRGGISQLKKTIGIGKYYDDDKIQPGSRVDQYWAGLSPSPGNYGVEPAQGKHYTSVPDAIQNFNLYSIEFGNWLNQSERLNFMYATMATLRDMAKVIGTTQKGMGLGKKLSIAFGSRGKGGFAAAFYQGQYSLINLTKTQGRGTFCHEYGHAVDDLLGWKSEYRSVRKQPNYQGKRKGTVAFLFEEVLDGVLWNPDGSESTYNKWLQSQSPYYNRRAEIWARVCETFFLKKFKEAGIKNSWGVRPGHDLPSAALVAKVEPQIRKIFQAACK